MESFSSEFIHTWKWSSTYLYFIFLFQVVGRSQTHVPTAISTPNPFAFPTLSGSPVIVPSSAAAPGQLMPVYSPQTGHIFLQNYQQVCNYLNFSCHTTVFIFFLKLLLVKECRRDTRGSGRTAERPYATAAD